MENFRWIFQHSSFGCGEPEITTLVLKHEKSLFDFSFQEESDGTKRLFDLMDMLMKKKEDMVLW